ncbi:hypothetical protein ACQ4PT_051727 [Festuca glaucescens]
MEVMKQRTKYLLTKLLRRYYLYWEKVQPQDDPTLTLRYSVRPLMRNWTEAAIGRRDDYDTENGRGRGVVKIENNITEEYREEITKIPVPKQKVNSARKSTGTGKSEVTPRSTKKASSTMEMRMETMLKRMVKELQRDIIQELPDICAKKFVELMNKGGVMYKRHAGSMTNDDGLDEGTGSFHNGPMENKEFMEQKESDTPPAHGSPPNGHAAANNGGDFVNVEDEKLFSDDFVTPQKPNGSHFIGVPGTGTPADPWIINDTTTPASSSSVPSAFLQVPTTNGRDAPDVHVLPIENSISMYNDENKCSWPAASMKRKRKLPPKLRSPMVLESQKKRQNRTASKKDLLDSLKDVPQDSATLSAKEISAAVLFVELAGNSEKHGKKNVYKSSVGDLLTTRRLKVILEHQWLSDDVIDAYLGDLSIRCGEDRYLCTAWRSSFLLRKHKKWDSTKKSRFNQDHELVKNGAIQRVMDEYFAKDKAYFPVNIDDTHWNTVVMHIPKEFQVLDSLYHITQTIDTVKALRSQITVDIAEANSLTNGMYPDVSDWPIKSYDMPKQKRW